MTYAPSVPVTVTFQFLKMQMKMQSNIYYFGFGRSYEYEGEIIRRTNYDEKMQHGCCKCLLTMVKAAHFSFPCAVCLARFGRNTESESQRAFFFNSVPIPPQALMLMVVKWSILDSMQLVFSSHNLSKLELATIQTKFNFTFAFIRKPECLPDKTTILITSSSSMVLKS